MNNETVLLVGVALSAVAMIAAPALAAFVLIRLPADYFRVERPRTVFARRHPLIRGAAQVLKNLTGGAVIALGVVLLLPGVPGPGLVTVVIGVMLIDFPAMCLAERSFIRRPAALRGINRLRRRFGRPPLAPPH